MRVNGNKANPATTSARYYLLIWFYLGGWRNWQTRSPIQVSLSEGGCKMNKSLEVRILLRPQKPYAKTDAM